MYALFGVIFHVIGGVAAGSFYMPYKKVKKWNWESYWIVGGISAWLIVPLILTAVTVPGFSEIIKSAPQNILGYVFLFGVLWGIGGLTFGLGIRYLGLSLGNSLILGLSLVFGALTPLVFYIFYPMAGKADLIQMVQTRSGQFVIVGIVLSMIGIFLCGKAGMMKEKQISGQKTGTEFNLKKGLLVAILSGILSACFNYGIEAGKSLADEVIHLGLNPLFQNNVTFVVLLWGGLLTNLIWCLFLNYKNKSFKDYSNTNSPLFKNYFLCFLAGAIWFLQFFFYGMGESRLGNGASSWVLHMTAIILVGNLWGVFLKEWKGVNKRTKLTISMGILILLSSIGVVGYGNSLSY